MTKRTIEVDVVDYERGRDCDGCGRKVPAGERMLTGIESCCGGCYRNLCAECVAWAAEQLEKAEQVEPVEGTCKSCGRDAPLVDDECPDCRH